MSNYDEPTTSYARYLATGNPDDLIAHLAKVEPAAEYHEYLVTGERKHLDAYLDTIKPAGEQM